jgi:hypothetical protein
MIVKVKAALLLAMIFAAVPATSKAQVDPTTGNYFYGGCKALQQWPTSNPVAYECAGVLKTLIALSDHVEPSLRFCMPRRSNLGQANMVITNYLERNPQIMHENFIKLSLNALSSAWPCR